MTLESYLVSKLGIQDMFTARVLIRDGFVLVNGREIRRHDFPVSTQDKVTFSDIRTAKMPRGYFLIREIQNELSIFNKTTDALCIGTDGGVLQYLAENHVSVANAGLEKSGINGVSDIIINPMTEKITSRHPEKFNYIILGQKFGLFTVFGILESNSDALLLRGNALVELNENESFSHETLLQFVERSGFCIQYKIMFDIIDPGKGWLILKKRKQQ